MTNATEVRFKKGDFFEVKLAVFLIILSAALFLIHYSVFRDFRFILQYLLYDIAFLPIEVLLVTIIVDRLLERREKALLLNKMNMVIGIFFGEVGTRLLEDISKVDKNLPAIKDTILGGDHWSAKAVAAKKKTLAAYQPDLDGELLDLPGIKKFLMDRRTFLLGLLENPNLLEHQHFTDLLWAVFHLLDELSHRDGFVNLPKTDIAHLTGDTNRAYLAILRQWIDYMLHLKNDYPYLFSLAVRVNPFDPKASIIVQK